MTRRQAATTYRRSNNSAPALRHALGKGREVWDPHYCFHRDLIPTGGRVQTHSTLPAYVRTWIQTTTLSFLASHHDHPFLPPLPNLPLTTKFCPETTYRRPASGVFLLLLFQKKIGRRQAHPRLHLQFAWPSAAFICVCCQHGRRAAALTSKFDSTVQSAVSHSPGLLSWLSACSGGAARLQNSIFGLPASGVFLQARGGSTFNSLCATVHFGLGLMAEAPRSGVKVDAMYELPASEDVPQVEIRLFGVPIFRAAGAGYTGIRVVRRAHAFDSFHSAGVDLVCFGFFFTCGAFSGVSRTSTSNLVESVNHKPARYPQNGTPSSSKPVFRS
ncbi:hypothetical protein C8R47DRAFT_1081084 [Mycena vitilis]|nr:hypothetical protein C8R47DRAFT_1081084 [Mycena vitilis]